MILISGEILEISKGVIIVGLRELVLRQVLSIVINISGQAIKSTFKNTVGTGLIELVGLLMFCTGYLRSSTVTAL